MKNVSFAVCAAVVASSVVSSAETSTTTTLPASRYVQDGLVLMLDGIENAGPGQHDSAATRLVDLSGSGLTSDLSADETVGDSFVHLAQKHRFEKIFAKVATFTDLKAVTIQYVVHPRQIAGATWGADSCAVIASVANVGSVFYHQKSDTGLGQTYKKIWRSSGGQFISQPFEYNHISTSPYGKVKIAGLRAQDEPVIGTLICRDPNFATPEVSVLFGETTYAWSRFWSGDSTMPTDFVSVGNSYEASDAYSIRVYNRVLTSDEIALNNALDRARFLGEELPAKFRMQVGAVGPQPYDGSGPVTPEPTVYDLVTGETLTKDVDYTLAYEGNGGVGTGSVTVTGQKAYAGVARTVSFEIFPAYGGIQIFAKPDAVDTDETDCSTWAKAGSLTNAFARAEREAGSGRVVVVLGAGLYDFSDIEATGTFLTLTRQNVTIRSASGEPGDVVVRGAGEGSDLRFLSVETTAYETWLQGLTIERFRSSGAGAALAINWSKGNLYVTVTNCVFGTNRGVGSGGAVSAPASGAVECRLWASVFTNNFTFGAAGGGLGMGWNKVHGCTFVDNVCSNNNAAASGGAAGAGTFDDCTFIGNRVIATGGSSQGNGGALYCPSTIERCVFRGNSASGYGQSVCCTAVTPTAVDSEFSAHASGSAVMVNGATERCVFSNNQITVAQSVALKNTLITGNRAPAASGKRLVSGGRLLNCTVTDNDCSWTGDWNCCLVGNAVCVNSVIANNRTKYAIVVNAPNYWTIMTNCVWSCDTDPNVPSGAKIVKVKDGARLGTRLLRDKGTMDGTGYTAASHDLLGKPRVVTNGKTLAEDPAALPDIGCVEVQERWPGLMLIIR